MRLLTLTGNELRKKFLDFFAGKEHLVLPSYPLVPENDPTLLLIGAGMAPFKAFFTGKVNPPKTRISTCQKCVRTGDIENVGRTARHHTFFEMLGNFSFGDYFKREAIFWGWEFLTKELEMSPERLWITIHTEDDEAFDIWHKEVGIPAERIIRMADNFWEIGPGPCGPCSELYYDLGEERGCGSPDCAVGCDCDRYLEIWNLVFTQYDRDEEGNYTPLVKKNIDTGAGLERIASVLQNKPSNFETDLLFPIIEHICQVSSLQYAVNPKTDVSLKVIADHARSMVVMIGDGILPSNEGRGYVLRRILRRAVRHGRLLGISDIFLADTLDVVLKIFAEVFPELAEKRSYIQQVIRQEEERFQATLAQGLELLNREIDELKAADKIVLEGKTAFKLYDTFGFPWELTLEILEEQQLAMDKEGFDAAMREQRERARAARGEAEIQVAIPDLSSVALSECSYDEAATCSSILAMWKDGALCNTASDGDEIALVLDKTSFYAEGGGQVGDIGQLIAEMGRMDVIQTKKLPDGSSYHIAKVEEGSVKLGETVTLCPDLARKTATARNHTATHLLHAALKKVLGNHVNQAGSLVGPERLRFDFSHFSAITAEELRAIENAVNAEILTATATEILETTQSAAKEMGAMALFGEKYGEAVRVVLIGDASKELCGGTHVKNTAEIGTFKIVAESSVGSGLRRIEAFTGFGTLQYMQEQEDLLEQAAQLLKTRPSELNAKISALFEKNRELEQQIKQLEQKLAKGEVDELLQSGRTLQNLSIVLGQVAATDANHLRDIADLLKAKMGEGFLLLAAVIDDKVNFVAMATPSAIAKGAHAGKVIKEAAKTAGGGGGGKPEMAQAGGKDPSQISASLAAAWATLETCLRN